MTDGEILRAFQDWIHAKDEPSQHREVRLRAEGRVQLYRSIRSNAGECYFSSIQEAAEAIVKGVSEDRWHSA